MAGVIGNPATTSLERARDLVQYIYPPLLLAVFVLVGAYNSIRTASTSENVAISETKGPGGKPLPATKRKQSQDKRSRPTRFSPFVRSVFQSFSMGVSITLLATGSAIAAHALAERSNDGEHGWWCGEPKTVFVLGSCLFYVYFSITLFDWVDSPNMSHLATWVIALIQETMIIVCDANILSGRHKIMTNLKRNEYTYVDGPDTWDIVDLSFSMSRICLIFGMLLVYLWLEYSRLRAERIQLEDEECRFHSVETTPLLNGRAAYRYGNGHAAVNGSAEAAPNGSSNGANHPAVDEDAGFYRPEKLPQTTWYEYLRGYTVFFPYMWPSKRRNLQAIVIVCFVLLVLQRVVNILVPRQIEILTNELSRRSRDDEEPFRMPWLSLVLLIVYKLLQGPSGLLGSLRSLLWIPVSQHTYRALMTSAFQHVHSLGLDFHLGKRTGEVLSALNKGASVNSFLEQITFQVFPMLIDLILAIMYFYIHFDAVYAVIVSSIVFYYLFLTIRMASTTADQRRTMSNLDREEEAVKNDSIISYETVKYFNAEDYEFNRYREAVLNFQAAEAKVTWNISLMNVCQSLVFMSGLLVVMMLGAYQVTVNFKEVGAFIALLTYMGQLQGPLNFFGTFYRTVQQSLISGERLLELFKQQPSVVDKPGAKPMTTCAGEVEFSKVDFAYDPRKPALRDLTFLCRPGTTTALVGQSGGGKSTLFRLMYRYYNCQAGNIKVDGQNVKDITIDSIRRHIGVVPQDTIMFNDTLMYNLKYANQNATEEEIYAACEAASIHERILTFPDKYDTKVGERGLRLSGGEKQRIAIARTILKNPKIIMLDEATSALDSHTEQEIQARLARIGQGRTVLIIAHRLSTITHADQILVMEQGRIKERGNHEKLLSDKGTYAQLWNMQATAAKAADDARTMTKKADKLMRKAHIPRTGASGPSSGNATGNEDSSSSDESYLAPSKIHMDNSRPAP